MQRSNWTYSKYQLQGNGGGIFFGFFENKNTIKPMH